MERSMVGYLMIQPQHRRNGFCVANCAFQNHTNRGRQRNHPQLNYFVGFGLCGPARSPVARYTDMVSATKPGLGIKLKDAPPMGGGESSLFQEFAFGSGQGQFAAIDRPAGISQR